MNFKREKHVKRNGGSKRRVSLWFAVVVLAAPAHLRAGQQPETPPPKQPAGSASQLSTARATATSTAGTITELTLHEALELAEKNSTQLQAAKTDEGISNEERNIARSSLLPNLNFNTSAIYTEVNGIGQPKYIANNGAQEYISEGNVHQQLDLAGIA